MKKHHTEGFGIYHWDTFDKPGDDTTLLESRPTVNEAIAYVLEKYDGKISGSGADCVEIVDTEGRIVVRFNVR